MVDASSLQRSEIVRINVQDIQPQRRGMAIFNAQEYRLNAAAAHRNSKYLLVLVSRQHRYGHPCQRRFLNLAMREKRAQLGLRRIDDGEDSQQDTPQA